jgi:hypothetical protein
MLCNIDLKFIAEYQVASMKQGIKKGSHLLFQKWDPSGTLLIHDQLTGTPQSAALLYDLNIHTQERNMKYRSKLLIHQHLLMPEEANFFDGKLRINRDPINFDG